MEILKMVAEYAVACTLFIHCGGCLRDEDPSGFVTLAGGVTILWMMG